VAVDPLPSRILVVEDDADVRDVLTQCLDAEGYTVDQAANGQEALDHLRAGLLPCLILLDLKMPMMDGPEFRRQQLANPAWAAIPVVVLSSLTDGAHLAALLRAVAFLVKPFRIAELLAIARQHCPYRRQMSGS
jgi:CheY-like chemotaxis protein